ncbi:Nicotinate dehydrogenase FAD-subunit [invertebrate metagenome]|uniref:Nicotinate dehydrogenase FAD-subunit n=1 Tax=invertebrate metagenome TaxID=1711999 RepID=A0A2H9T9T9_9ZZZZ
MFAIETYYRPHSVKEACARLHQESGSRLIAGGTDVLIRLREGKKEFGQLVDIHGLPELSRLEQCGDGTLMLGSGVTFSQLIHFLQSQRLLPALVEGASAIGGPQVRNMATLGGNICNGAPSADSAAPLLVMDADVHIQGYKASRVVSLGDFYQGPGRVELAPDEVVTHFSINPACYQDTGSYFYKYAMRKAMDIATIGCAAACQIHHGIIRSFKIAYTVAAPVPKRCYQAEKIAEDAQVSQALIRDMASVVLEDLSPRESWRAGKAFREHIIRTLAQKVILKAMIRGGADL